MRKRSWTRWLIGGAVALMAAAPAYAQPKKTEVEAPYDVSGIPHYKVWAPWIFAFLFVGGVALVAFKNPHRTHLD